MTPPLITCIVAVFNGERYLHDAIASILAQTYRPIDVLIVDDGSTDATPAIVARQGSAVRSVRRSNAGPATARNHGLREARGDLVAFLDADDLWHPEKLARQAARFDVRPELEISCTHVQNFWEPEVHDEAVRLQDHRLSQPTPGYSVVTLLARRALFDRVGPFDESWRHVHDTEWFVRAGERGAVTELLPDVLVSRRLHASNRSRLGADASREEYLRLVKARIAGGRAVRDAR